MNYRDYLIKLGFTEEELEEKMEELEESSPIEINSWDELIGTTLNEFKFTSGESKDIMEVRKLINGEYEILAVFDLALNPTFAIESWLIVHGLNVMIIGKRIYSEEDL